MNTHVIDAINGQHGWWYQAHYSSGWYEQNVFRMDMYPYKNDTRMQLYVEREQRLAEEGRLSNLTLTWYERIAAADPVDSYWVERVDEAQASGGCGFVYETGPRIFSGFSGSHIHIPSDVRVTVSPEYTLWFWICL